MASPRKASARGGGKAAGLLAALLFTAFALPALAGTTAPATAAVPLTVSQTPSIYAQKGVAPNLFLLLDDSGSMQFEYLGDRGTFQDDYGFPLGSSNPYNSDWNGTYCSTCAPGFEWNDEHHDIQAAQYRAAYVNPNYYDPSLTYTPWACAAPYPESEEQLTTAPGSIINPITNATGGSGCHWDSETGLWVLPDADPVQVYLNPAKTSAGFRDVEVWNDSDDGSNSTDLNGYVGNSGGEGCYAGHSDTVTCEGQPVSGNLNGGSGRHGRRNSDYARVPGTGPIHGSLDLDTDGSYTYTPDDGFVGTDFFSYTYEHCERHHSHYHDGNTCTDEGPETVTITVLAGEPAGGFWPATYFNYFGPRPGSCSGPWYNETCDYTTIADYERIQICPATATTNSGGTVSTNVCNPPALLPANPLPYHTYTDAAGNYVYVQSDGSEIVRTPAEELQNFANWYQYYRSHILLADAGIGIAFMQVPTGFRVDYGVINEMDDDRDGAEIKSTEDFTQKSATGLRYEFLHQLYTQSINKNGTPNREALESVGEWFDASAQVGKAPWGNSADEAATAGSAPLACRANYVILATDGEWTGDYVNPGNVDDETGPAIPATAGQAGYQYQPAAPYADDVENTLADVAMQYWEDDLQSSLDNDVPTNPNDGAFWQHLTTFTVGLGVLPTLVEDYMEQNPAVEKDAAQQIVFQQIASGDTDWPSPCGDGDNANDCNGGSESVAEKIDDTWHAAIDGHGAFTSAATPTELYDAINKVLVNIVNRTGAASSLSVNTEKTGQTRTRQQVFQALFHPPNWWGDVLALPVVTKAVKTPGAATRTVVALSSDADWAASCVLTGGTCPQMGLSASGQPLHSVTVQSPGDRNILTWDGSARAFDTTSLSAAAVSAIGGAGIVQYVRGVRSVETGKGGTLRVRTSVLGDVVRSSPVFVGAPGADYPNVWTNLLIKNPSLNENDSDAQTYGDFVKAEASRKPVVYVGANDGMLHAFYAPTTASAADAGKELMAYVPQAVYSNLRDYATAPYTHHYFVNATPGAGDLFYGDEWHTWLVGGEGAGGDSIFALNITNPASFSESNPSATVVHEWSPANLGCVNVLNCGQDLGLTFGTPVITRFNNGRWGFVFGNGFNSASGVASIFIGLVGAGGTVTFYELSTGYGPSNDPEGKNRPDGIAFVTAVDLNGDYSTDYIYAGDYFGNVWRFNVTSSSASGWSAEYDGTKQPMFEARNANGSPQPITTKLLVVAVPGAGAGFRIMVEFGTGAAITNTEQAPNLTATGVQSLYGIWDWDLDGWNSGTPTIGMSAKQPIAFQYASRRTGPSASAYTRSDLSVQSITVEQTTSTVQGGINNNRVVSQNPVCWVDATTAGCTSNDKYGWYMDLLSPNEGQQGEKVVYNPVLRSGAFLVNTTIPNTSSGLTCQAAANNGWTMGLDPETGSRLPFEVFDTIGNGKFEPIVVNGSETNTSGITLGAVGSPGFIAYDGNTYLVVNTASGQAKIVPLNLGDGKLAVQLSWQELR